MIIYKCRRKNKSDELLLFIRTNSDNLDKQTQTKAQETLENERIKKKTFSFDNPLILEVVGKWFLGLTSGRA